ncbi:MAG: NADH-quinone oxidoreductase subunit L [Gemmatales bacterium]|nr:NADH-quinone oxidoreductase subunit L [Gemmatales bacterium]MDW7995142.1 NADH-quinone oxidoreductase subunit L [Gemmatales bacterium]
MLENPGWLFVGATLLPLVSFLLLLIGGRHWGRAAGWIATAAIGAAFVLSLIGATLYLPYSGWFAHHHHGHHHSAGHEKHEQHAGPAQKAGHEHDHEHVTLAQREPGVPPWQGGLIWAKVSTGEPGQATGLRLGFYVDGLTVAMFVMITLVATLIHIFSTGYMAEELQDEVHDHQAHVVRAGRYPRFFTYMSLFCFSMLNLVLADNLFQIFISWELVGICSYLLIGYYYERRSASNAANKAFITNRVGDAGFIIGAAILWTYCGTLTLPDTVREQRNAKGEVVRVVEPGLFSRLRMPATDSHGTPLPAQLDEYIGNFARVEPISERSSGDAATRYRFSSSGPYVLLFTADHFHGEDLVLDDGISASTSPSATGLSVMPYWALVLAGIGVFLGCVGKSAQFPLHVWLPDAMEGPTPVSALIHAATMVAAGVYLVGRAFPMFTSEVLLVIAYVGAITLFVAATIALVQTDIKKVLAYSTVSQLGFMMLALGVGGWIAGLFHLLTHAFFKALLFLGSGSVIHGCHHEQDMMKMGGLYDKMKITALTMLVGVLAIAGAPLFSGWYSKDAIMVSALSFVVHYPQHMLLFLLPLITVAMTAFYMFRLWYLTFTGEPRDEHVYEHAHESPAVMTVPLIVLAFFSVTVAWGWPPWDAHASALEHYLDHEMPIYLHPDPDNRQVDKFLAPVRKYAEQPEAFPNVQLPEPHALAGLLALLSAGIGFLLATTVYYWGYLDPEGTRQQFASVYDFLWEKWHFDELYRWIAVRPALVLARVCRWFDLNVIDGLVDGSARATVRVSQWDGKFDLGIIDGLVNLTADVIYAVGAWLRNVQTGFLRNYVLFLALAAVGIFALVSYILALVG